MSGPLLASYIFLWILVVVLAVAVFALYQHFGQMYLNSELGRNDQGPPIGEQLPRMVAVDVRGTPIDLPRGANTLLAFMEVDCKLCGELRPALISFANEKPEVDVVAVVAGRAAEVEKFGRTLSEHVSVVADPAGRLTTRFGVGAFPFAMRVDNSGIVKLKALVNGRAGLDALEAASNGTAADHGREAIVA